MAALATACGGSTASTRLPGAAAGALGSATPSGKVSKDVIRIAYSAPTLMYLPLWAAYDLKFFQRYGLQPAPLALIQGGNAVSALVGGSVDLAGTDGYAVAKAVKAGAPVVMVGATTTYATDAIITDPSITRPGQLKGVRVGGAGPASDPVWEFKLYLQRVGLNANQVHFVTVGNGFELLGALQKGTIQAAAISSPYWVVAQSQHLHVLADLLRLKIPWTLTAFDVSRTELRTHPGRVTRMMEAIADAAYYLKAHPEEIQRLVKKYMRQSNPAFLSAAVAAYREQLPHDLQLLPSAVQNIGDVAQLPADKSFYDGSVLGHLEKQGFFQALRTKYGLSMRPPGKPGPLQ